MTAKEKLKMTEQMEKVLIELGFPYYTNINENSLNKRRETEIGEKNYVGNHEILTDKGKITTFIRFLRMDEDEYLTETKINIPTTTKDFIETYEKPFCQKEDESIENYIKRFKNKILEARIKMLFKGKENYEVERMIGFIKTKVEMNGEELDREKFIKEVFKKTGQNTEEDLERVLLTLACNLDKETREGNPIAIYIKLDDYEEESRLELKEQFRIDTTDFVL